MLRRLKKERLYHIYIQHICCVVVVPLPCSEMQTIGVQLVQLAAADLKFKAVFRIHCSVLKIKYSVFGVRYSE